MFNNTIISNISPDIVGFFCQGFDQRVQCSFDSIIGRNNQGVAIYCNSPYFCHVNNSLIEFHYSIGGAAGFLCENFNYTSLERSSSCQIENSIVRNTISQGGGSTCSYMSNCVFKNMTFEGNVANFFGGGVSCYYANCHISDSTFIRNSAISNQHSYTGTGGGLACFSSSCLSEDNLFDSNIAINGGNLINFPFQLY